MSVPPLVSVAALEKHFGGQKHVFGQQDAVVRAVDGVSLDIRKGEVVGLVGESGSGKTTVGRMVLRLTDPTNGRILFDGQDITAISQRQMLPVRRRMQMVFQDPFASLNPRLTVGETLIEPLHIHRIGKAADRQDRVAALLERVGLSRQSLGRYPHEFSGGQRQRIVIARALSVTPDFIVADEPVSALDVSIQAQIINLLVELQGEFGLTMLFISHDLSVVEYLCDRVVVMYLGRVMESGPTDTIFARPHHPYTQALLSAVPQADTEMRRERIVLSGDMPSPAHPPAGCVFHTRCQYAIDACKMGRPADRVVGPDHRSACLREDIPR